MNLATLPSDIVAQILGLLNPADILNVRATCKPLAEVTFQRFIWHKAFAEILRKHVAVNGSYDLNLMTLEELESAAMKPTRFLKRVLTSNENLPATSTRTLDWSFLASDDAYSEPDDPPFTDAFLIAGGRFLITVYKYRLLSLWDLTAAVGHRPSGIPQPITSIHPQVEVLGKSPSDWEMNLHEVKVTDDRMAIRMIVTLDAMTEDSDSRLCVYEIHPGSEHPTFHLLHTSPTPEFGYDDSSCNAFDGDRFAFVTPEDKIIVWDLNSGSSVSWETQSDWDFSVSAMTMKDNRLFLFHDLSSVEIYDLSAFNFGGDKKHTLLDVSLIPRIAVERSDATDIKETSPFDSYTYFASQPQYATEPLSLIAYHEDWDDPELPSGQHPAIEVFAVEPLDKNGQFKKPLLRLRATIQPETQRITAAWGCFVGDSYLVMWGEPTQESTSIKFSALAPQPFDSGSSQTAIKHKTTRVAQIGMPERLEMFDFCQVSTKLVFLAGGEVHISEFNQTGLLEGVFVDRLP